MKGHSVAAKAQILPSLIRRFDNGNPEALSEAELSRM